MQTCSGRGDRATLFCIDGLIAVSIVVASLYTVDVRRQRRFANSIDYVIEIRIGIELNQAHAAVPYAGNMGLQETIGEFDLVADSQASCRPSQGFPGVARDLAGQQ